MLSSLLQRVRIPYREDKVFGMALLSIFVTPLLFYSNLLNSYDGPRLALLLILLGIALIYLAFKQQLSFHIRKPLLFLFGGFILFGLISTIFSYDITSSIWAGYIRHADSLIFAICWILLILLYSLLDSDSKLYSLFRVWVLVGSLVAILGILHSFGIGYYAGMNAAPRPLIPGFEGNQNFSAMLLTGILPLLWPLASRAKNRLNLLIYVLCGLLMMWGLAVFASRGSIIATGLSLLFGLGLLLVKKTGWKMRVSVVTALVACALLATLFYRTTRLPGVDTSLNIQADGSALNRIELWANSLDIIRDNPWTGLGFSNFIIGSLSWGDTSFASFERFDDAHNLFIHIAASAGLPALIFFLAILGFCFRTAFVDFWRTKSLSSWAVMLGMIGLLISACFNPVTIANWLLLAFLLAVSQANAGALTNFKIGKIAKPVLIAAGSIMILFAFWFAASQYISQMSEEAYKKQDFDRTIKLGNFSEKFNPFSTGPKMFAAAAMIRKQVDPAQVRPKIESLHKFHERVQTLYTNSGTLYYMLYLYSQSKSDLTKSYADLEIADILQPRDVLILNRYAYIAYLVGDRELAEKKINLALTTGHKNPNFAGFLLASQIFLEKGNGDAMYRMLKKANDITPTPVIQKALDEYERGEFKRDKIPVYFPGVDI